MNGKPKMVCWIDEDNALMLVARKLGSANFADIEPVLADAKESGLPEKDNL